MEAVYIPKCVKEGKFEGSVTLQHLSFEEHCEAVAADLEVSREEKGAYVRHLMRRVIGWKDKFVKVELVRKKDGVKFTSFADLSCGGADCRGVLGECAGWLVNGDQEEDSPGNGSSAQSDSK